MNSPVLTIHGKRDRNAPYGAGHEWAAHLPNARLITIEAAAHQSFAEYPEIVIPAIRTFLRGAWPSSAMEVSYSGRSASNDRCPGEGVERRKLWYRAWRESDPFRPSLALGPSG